MMSCARMNRKLPLNFTAKLLGIYVYTCKRVCKRPVRVCVRLCMGSRSCLYYTLPFAALYNAGIAHYKTHSLATRQAT